MTEETHDGAASPSLLDQLKQQGDLLERDDIPPGRPSKLEEFASPEFREEIATADIIWAWDEDTHECALLFGRSRLRNMEGATLMWGNILPATTELEALVAVVLEVKGEHEYINPSEAGFRDLTAPR